MHAFIRRHEVWVFLVSIVVVNTVFVTAIVDGFLPRGLYGYGRFALLAAVLAGIVMLARGLPGIADLLRPMLEWRRSPHWYIFALTWSAIGCVLVLSVKGLLLGTGLSEVRADFSVVGRPKMMLTMLISSFIGEIVWVSYAIRRLSRSFTPYVSALIVGAVWTAWWLPMAVHNFGIVPDLPLVALLINQCGIAVMCAFIYMHTRSGLLVLCMQIMFNAMILVFPVTPSDGGAATYWAFALYYFCSGLALFLIFGPRPLLRKERAEGDAALGSTV